MHVQLIDLQQFFDARFFINLSRSRSGAAWRGLCTGFPTKLSTECVSEDRAGRRAGGAHKLRHNRRLLST